MALHTLIPLSFASSPTFLGFALSTIVSGVSPTGDTDSGICLQTLLDGKTLSATLPPAVNGDAGTAIVYWEDDAQIPMAATINSVTLNLYQSGSAQIDSPAGNFAYRGIGGQAQISFVDATQPLTTSGSILLNPSSGDPWARADLFNDNDAGGLGFGGFGFGLVYTGGGFQQDIDRFELVVDYTAGGVNPEIGATYDLDVDEPPVRKFDGFTDRIVAKIPKSLV